jgi:hypothetical protein
MTDDDLAKIRRTHPNPGAVDMTGIVEELKRFDAPPWMIERARELAI